MAHRRKTARVPRGYGRLSGRFVSRETLSELRSERRYIREAERAERLAVRIEQEYERADEAASIREQEDALAIVAEYEAEEAVIRDRMARIFEDMARPPAREPIEPSEVERYQRDRISPPELPTEPLPQEDLLALDSALERALFDLGFEDIRVKFSQLYDRLGRVNQMYEVVSRNALQPDEVKAIRDTMLQMFAPEYGGRMAIAGVKVGTAEVGIGDEGWRTVTFSRDLENVLGAVDYKVDIWHQQDKYHAQTGFFGIFIRIGE